jgi:hypothetical protein
MIRSRSPDPHVPRLNAEAEKLRAPTADSCSPVNDDVACGVPAAFSLAHATDT